MYMFSTQMITFNQQMRIINMQCHSHQYITRTTIHLTKSIPGQPDVLARHLYLWKFQERNSHCYVDHMTLPKDCKTIFVISGYILTPFVIWMYCSLSLNNQQAPTWFSELTFRAGQVVNDFDMPDIIFELPEISYNICWNGMYLLSQIECLPFSFQLYCIVCIFQGISAIFYIKLCFVYR